MSQPPVRFSADASTEQFIQPPTGITDEAVIQDILDALHDEDCRAILKSTPEERLSAKEISRRCELPLSTTYRKLDTLTETGLLEEGIRLCQTGNHATEYARVVVNVQISFDDCGQLKLWLSRDSSGARSIPPVTRVIYEPRRGTDTD